MIGTGEGVITCALLRNRAANPGGMGDIHPPPQYLTSIPPIISIFAHCSESPNIFLPWLERKIFGGRKMQDRENLLGVKEFEPEVGKKG